MSVTNSLLGFPNRGQIGGSGSYFVPPEYYLNTPKNGARILRTWRKRDITTSMPVTDNNPILRWNIPNEGVKILDFRRATVYFYFSAHIVSSNPTLKVRPSALMWNLVDRFRLEQAGQYVEDRRYYGFQETLSYRVATHIAQQSTTGEALFGDGPRGLRQFKTNNNKVWKYALPIPSTALTKCIMPWYCVGRDGRATAVPEVWLQWELTSPNNFLEAYGDFSQGTSYQLSYTITRCVVEYEEIFGDGGNNTIITNWTNLPSAFPPIYYRSFLTNKYPLSTSLDQTINIEFKLSSIIAIYVTFHIDGDLSDPSKYDRFETYLGKGDLPLLNYQFDINGCLWPDQPVEMNDDAWVSGYLMYQRAFQMYHSRIVQQEVTPIDAAEFTSNKFILVLDCNEHPMSSNIINPVSTRSSTQNIQLKLAFTAAPSTNIICLAHVYHWRVWNFGANGGVPLVEQ